MRSKFIIIFILFFLSVVPVIAQTAQISDSDYGEIFDEIYGEIESKSYSEMSDDEKFDSLKPYLNVHGVVKCSPAFEYTSKYQSYEKKPLLDKSCSEVCEPFKELLLKDHLPTLKFALEQHANTSGRPTSMYDGVVNACNFGTVSLPSHLSSAYKRVPEVLRDRVAIFSSAILLNRLNEFDEANRLTKISADLGYAHAQYIYGLTLHEQGKVKDAFIYLNKAVEGGSMRARGALKSKYDYTYTSNEDRAKAALIGSKYVVADKLNARSKPSVSGAILKSYPFGHKVSVYEQRDGWSRITYKGEEVWLSDKYLSLSKPKTRLLQAGPRGASSNSGYIELADMGRYPVSRSLKTLKRKCSYREMAQMSVGEYDSGGCRYVRTILSKERDHPYITNLTEYMNSASWPE